MNSSTTHRGETLGKVKRVGKRTAFVGAAITMALGCTVLSGPPASAAPIPIASVTCTGSWSENPTGIGFYGCAGAIDGIINDTVPGPTGNASYWLGRQSDTTNIFQLNETLTFDLGGLFLVNAVDLYNTHNGVSPTAE
jgi:hypothetical protein